MAVRALRSVLPDRLQASILVRWADVYSGLPGRASESTWLTLLTLLCQDSRDPDEASYGLVEGACGYGLLDRSQWPYWRAVGLGASNPIASEGSPLDGCGTCIRIECTGTVSRSCIIELICVHDNCDRSHVSILTLGMGSWLGSCLMSQPLATMLYFVCTSKDMLAYIIPFDERRMFACNCAGFLITSTPSNSCMCLVCRDAIVMLRLWLLWSLTDAAPVDLMS